VRATAACCCCCCGCTAADDDALLLMVTLRINRDAPKRLTALLSMLFLLNGAVGCAV
jgi:hypothetical protein